MVLIKNVIKSIIRYFGWNLERFDPANKPSGQLLAALKLIDADLIFDIGANVGQFAQELRLLGFGGRIVSFEPLSSAHAALLKNSKSDAEWIIHPRVALGDTNGELTINISGNSVSSSILSMLDAHSDAAVDSTYITSESTPVIMLDSIESKYLEKYSSLFVKIDTQGYEWNVLDGAFDTLKRANGIMIELTLVPLYHDQKLWLQIIERLQNEGFTLWTIQEGFTDNRTGRTLQLDAIFLRH